MKHLTFFVTLAVCALLSSCNSSSKNVHEDPASIPEGKEIKMDDVDSQLKTDAERADSMKKALGIE